MLTVGFIQPTSSYLHDPFRGDPFTHLQILTVLKNVFGDSINARLIDLRGIAKKFAIYHIPECDIYLHSIYTLDYEEQKDLVGMIRVCHPNALHMAGGPHVHTFPNESAAIFDAIFLGDGEDTIVQAIIDFKNSKLKKIYAQKIALDINAYPHMMREFLPKAATARRNIMTLKRRSGFDQILGATTLFSRGCPFSCHFCAIDEIRVYPERIRYRSPENVGIEIEYLKRMYGIGGINVMDEIGIPLKNELAIAHLEAIGKTNILWRGQCRVDGITPEIARMARESGCVALGLGIESVLQQCLNAINKRIKVEQSKETIRVLNQNGIETRIYVIFGLPGETEDVMERTWEFIQETNPDMVLLSLFTIRPGTEIFRHPDRFGIKRIDTNWAKTMHMFGRYSDEVPELTFEYHENTPWGKALSGETIIKNYLELQNRLKEYGLASP